MVGSRAKTTVAVVPRMGIPASASTMESTATVEGKPVESRPEYTEKPAIKSIPPAAMQSRRYAISPVQAAQTAEGFAGW
jgi:hypothetical protein